MFPSAEAEKPNLEEGAERASPDEAPVHVFVQACRRALRPLPQGVETIFKVSSLSRTLCLSLICTWSLQIGVAQAVKIRGPSVVLPVVK